MSLHRRRFHTRLALAYLLVAWFAPVAHFHARARSAAESVRVATFEHEQPGSSALADRPCDCPACHFSTTHVAVLDVLAWFDSSQTGSASVRTDSEVPGRPLVRGISRAPPSVRA